MYLMSEFSDQFTLAGAIQALKMRGADAADLDVFSTEPVDLPAGLLDRPSRMSLLTVCGGAGIGLLSVLFVYWTQHNYEILTGGMPYFSPWATGVIHFELTMLGAVAGCFLTFLWESGILRRDKRAPVPKLASGVLYLRVRCEPSQMLATGECLYQAGAGKVEKLEARA
jgi:hypothetical protein